MLEYDGRVNNIDDFFNEAACIIQSRLMATIRARKFVRVMVDFAALYIQNEHQEAQHEDYIVHSTAPTWLYSANDVNEFFNVKVSGDIKRKMVEFQLQHPNIVLDQILNFAVFVNDFDDELD